jgi:hypothetical protein
MSSVFNSEDVLAELFLFRTYSLRFMRRCTYIYSSHHEDGRIILIEFGTRYIIIIITIIDQPVPSQGHCSVESLSLLLRKGWGSSIGIATGYTMDGQGVRVRFEAGT